MGSRHNAIHDYNYQIHCVDDGGGIVETMGEVNNLAVAWAAYEAAIRQRSWSTIELRNMGRVMQVVKTGGYDSATKTVEILSRSD